MFNWHDIKNKIFQSDCTCFIVVVTIFITFLFAAAALGKANDKVTEGVDARTVVANVLFVFLVLANSYAGLWAWFHKDT